MGKQMEYVILQDVAEIINGKPLNESERIPAQDNEEAICLIQGANLGLLENSKKWGLDLVDVNCYKKTKDSYNNEVKIDDILLTGRGSEVHVARISGKNVKEFKEKHYLVGKNLYIIRLKDISDRRQLSKYLALYLASKTGKAVLKAKRPKGRNMQIQLNKGDIASLAIPFRTQKNKSICDDYENAWEKYNAAVYVFTKTIENIEQKLRSETSYR